MVAGTWKATEGRAIAGDTEPDDRPGSLAPQGPPTATPPPGSRAQAATVRAPRASSAQRAGSQGCWAHEKHAAVFKNTQSTFPKHGVPPVHYPCTNPGFWNTAAGSRDLPARTVDFGKHFGKRGGVLESCLLVYMKCKKKKKIHFCKKKKNPSPWNFVGILSG